MAAPAAEAGTAETEEAGTLSRVWAGLGFRDDPLFWEDAVTRRGINVAPPTEEQREEVRRLAPLIVTPKRGGTADALTANFSLLGAADAAAADAEQSDEQHQQQQQKGGAAEGEREGGDGGGNGGFGLGMLMRRRRAKQQQQQQQRGTSPPPSSSSSQGDDAEDADAGAGGAESSLSEDAGAGLEAHPRVLYMQGVVEKVGTEAVIKRNNRRHLFLFNDVLLITTPKTMRVKNEERYEITHVLPVADLAFADSRYTGYGEQYGDGAFEVIGPERSFLFIADDAAAKAGWLHELELSIYGCNLERAQQQHRSEQERRPDTGVSVDETSRLTSGVNMVEAGCAALDNEDAKLIGGEEDEDGGGINWATPPNPVKTPGWRYTVVRSSLHSSAWLGDETVLQACLRLNPEEGPNIRDSMGLYPLHYAAVAGHEHIVRMLLEAGADVDCLNYEMNSPLHLAAAAGFAGIVEILLANDASPDLRNLKDRSPLFLAVIYGDANEETETIVGMLIRRGVDVNAFDTRGNAALHHAAAMGLVHSAKALCKVGAKVNLHRTPDQRTPLQVACAEGRLTAAEVVRHMLAAGAHVNWKDSQGKRAIELLLEGLPALMNATDAGAGAASPPPPPGQPQQKQHRAISEDLQMALVRGLPLLMEIVRAGAFCTPELMERLTDVVREACEQANKQWAERDQPERYLEFVDQIYVPIDKDSWVPDHDSPCCMSCGEAWTLSNRRHHCRMCGQLVCQLCTSKTLTLYDGYATVKSTLERRRVCDSCFNKACAQVVRHETEHAKLQRTMKELEQRGVVHNPDEDGDDPDDDDDDDDDDDGEGAGPEGGKRRQLFGGKRPTGAAGAGADNAAPGGAAAAAAGATGAAAAMADTMDAMNERGERLDRLTTKTGSLQEQARLFREAARKMREEQEQRRFW